MDNSVVGFFHYEVLSEDLVSVILCVKLAVCGINWYVSNSDIFSVLLSNGAFKMCWNRTDSVSFFAHYAAIRVSASLFFCCSLFCSVYGNRIQAS